MKKDNRQNSRRRDNTPNESNSKSTYQKRGRFEDKSSDRPYNRRGDKASNESGAKRSYQKRGRFDDMPEASERPYRRRDNSPNEYSEKRAYQKRDRFEDKFEHNEAPETALREDELPYLIMGRNAVREAVKSGRSIDKLLVIKERDGSLREIVNLARDRNIVIQEVTKAKLDELCMPFGHGGKSGNHQGIVARVPGAEYVSLEDILDYAKSRNEQPFILLLDGITDPYNLGSIIRSAECAGVHGIVIPKRRSATLTSAVVKVAAGAVDYMRVACVPNIAQAIDKLKKSGVWVAGADMQADISVYDADMAGAFAIVIGSEGEGLSSLVRSSCDYLINIPLKGQIESLNASVAAAVVMFEKNRQEIARQAE